MANVVTQFNPSGRVEKFTLEQHSDFPELMYTTYMIECWGARGGDDTEAYANGDYSSANRTYVAPTNGDYTRCYIDIIEDVDVYISVGTAGAMGAGGFYGGRGTIRSGGASIVSFKGTNGSNTPDTTAGRVIVSAKGGNSSTRIYSSSTTTEEVVSKMSECPDRLKRTYPNSYWKYTTSNYDNHWLHGYVLSDVYKKTTNNSTAIASLQARNIRSVRSFNNSYSFWMPIALFSFKSRTTFTFTWNSTDEQEITFRISCPYKSESYVKISGTGTTGSLSWTANVDISYSIDMYVEPGVGTDKHGKNFNATFSPIHTAYNGVDFDHNHVFVGTLCGDSTKAEVTTISWALENANTCSVGDSFLDTFVYEDNYHSLAYNKTTTAASATSPNGYNGCVKITRLDPSYYAINNIKNDDYRRLLVHRPVVGRELVDEVFERELHGVRKNRLIKDYDYNLNITQGYTLDNFQKILEDLTEILQNGSWSLLTFEEDTIFDEPGQYEYVFPEAGIYMFECWGASGGDDPRPEHDENDGYYDLEDLENNEEEPSQPYYELAGRGGYARGICYVNEDVEKVYIYVGGQGTMTSEEVTIAQGGFNGGGTVNRLIIEDDNSDNYERQFHYVDIGSGGGASDVRLNTSLYSRVIVAGGGAGKGLEELRGDAGGVSSNYITKYLSVINVRTLLQPCAANIRNDSNINANNFNSYELSILSNWNKINCADCSGNGYIDVVTSYGDPVGTVYDYPYTGNYQTRTLGAGKYKLEVWGAQGGYGGGYGGYSVGYITITEKTTFYIYVGGAGSTQSSKGTGGAGWNGGGSASSSGSASAGGGGGGTDIRKSGTSLNNRVIVAGGGGGDGSGSYRGGAGGGTNGEPGTGTSGSNSNYSWSRWGKGGTQTSGGSGGFCGGSITSTSTDYYSGGGSFGQGGSGYVGTSSSAYLTTPGGGGGWYGGGGGGNSSHVSGGTASGAGGGSGYIGGVQNGSMSTGVRSGDGYARITIIEVSTYVERRTCATCNGTKWHYDPNDLDNIVDQILDSKENSTLTLQENSDKYTAIVPQDMSSCIATDTAAGRDSSFGNGNTTGYTYYVADSIDVELLRSYITPMSQNIRSGDANITEARFGTWGINILNSYKVNCSKCSGTGTYSVYTGTDYYWYQTNTSCQYYGIKYWTNSTGTDPYHKNCHNSTWELRSQRNYSYYSCNQCNGTLWHYNPNKTDEIISKFGTPRLNSDDNGLPFATTNLLRNARTVTTKACGCGGGWYAGGTNRENRIVTRSGGGSSYVYKNNTAYPSNTNKPNKDWYCVNDEIISGTSLMPTPYSDPDHLDYERGHLGNGAVRIRKLKSIGAEILPQNITIVHDIYERRLPE